MNAPLEILSDDEFNTLLADGINRPPALSHLRSSDQIRAQIQTVTALLADLGPPPDQPSLLHRSPDGPPTPVPIEAGISVGRSASCSLPLPADSNLSKRHFAITQTEGHYFISDLNSTNGTTVNSQPTPPGQPRHLLDGDLIAAGHHLFVFLAGKHPPPPILAH